MTSPKFWAPFYIALVGEAVVFSRAVVHWNGSDQVPQPEDSSTVVARILSEYEVDGIKSDALMLLYFEVMDVCHSNSSESASCTS